MELILKYSTKKIKSNSMSLTKIYKHMYVGAYQYFETKSLISFIALGSFKYFLKGTPKRILNFIENIQFCTLGRNVANVSILYRKYSIQHHG